MNQLRKITSDPVFKTVLRIALVIITIVAGYIKESDMFEGGIDWNVILNLVWYGGIGLIASIVFIQQYKLSKRIEKVKEHSELIHWLDNSRFSKIDKSKFFKEDERAILREKMIKEYPQKTVAEVNDILDCFYKGKDYWKS